MWSADLFDGLLRHLHRRVFTKCKQRHAEELKGNMLYRPKQFVIKLSILKQESSGIYSIWLWIRLLVATRGTAVFGAGALDSAV